MERLTDDRFLKDGFYQPKSKDEEKEIRSMGGNLTFEKLYRHCAELEKKNAELQKKVNGLKEERENMQAVIFALEEEKRQLQQENAKVISFNDTLYREKQQAVKDTAKKIYGEIDDNDILVITTQEYGSIEVVPLERLQEIIKSKGVEVE